MMSVARYVVLFVVLYNTAQAFVLPPPAMMSLRAVHQSTTPDAEVADVDCTVEDCERPEQENANDEDLAGSSNPERDDPAGAGSVTVANQEEESLDVDCTVEDCERPEQEEANDEFPAATSNPERAEA